MHIIKPIIINKDFIKKKISRFYRRNIKRKIIITKKNNIKLENNSSKITLK
jgi:hypothetical protein